MIGMSIFSVLPSCENALWAVDSIRDEVMIEPAEVSLTR